MADEASVHFGGNTEGLESALRSATSSVEGALSGMAEHAESLTGIFEKLKFGFIALGAALGAEIFNEAIHSFTNLAENVEHTSMMLGISTEAASSLKIALEDIGSSTDVYVGAAVRMDRQLKTHEDAMNKIGVVTRDGNHNLLDQREIMQNALNTLMQYKEGTDRNQASIYLFGRSIRDIQPLFRLTEDVMEEAKNKAKEFGLELSENDVLAARNFKMQMQDLGDVFEGVMVKLGRELLPVFVQFITWLNDYGPEAVRRFSAALDGLNIAFTFIKIGVDVVIITFNELVRVVSDLIGGVVISIMKLGQGDFSGAKEALSAMVHDMKETLETGFKEMTRVAEEGKDKIEKLMTGEYHKPLPTGKATAIPKGTEGFTAPLTDEAQLAQFKEQLQLIHDSHADSLAKMTQTDIAFWRNVLAYASLSVKNYAAVFHELATAKHAQAQESYAEERGRLDLELADTRKNYQARMAILQQEAQLAKSAFGERSNQYRAALKAIETEEVKHKEELRKIQDEEIVQASDHSSRMIGLEKSRVDFEASLGAISAQRQITLQSDLETREYNIKLSALNQRLALYRSDEAEYRKIQTEIAALNDQHSLSLQEASQRSTLALKADWEEVLGSVSRTWDTTIQGWLQGTQTFEQGMSKIFLGILTDFISMTIQMGVKWAAMELANSNITSIQAGLRSLFGIESAATAATAQYAKSAGSVTSSAAEAGAAAFASTAAIPIVGPELAPAAAGAAYTGAISFLGAIPPAKTGAWDLPGDTMAYLHKGEAVLTNEQVQGFKQGNPIKMGDKEEEPKQKGQDLHVHVHAMDSKSVEKALLSGGALDQALRKWHRNFGSVNR